jgi:Protein of unknown function (DUF3618)
MSRPTSQDSASGPERLREETERIRSDLAETVDALAARADVKSRVQEKAAETREQVQQKVSTLGAQAKDTASAVSSQAKERAGAVGDQAKDKVRQARGVVRENPVLVAAGGAALVAAVAVALGVRRGRTRRRSRGGRR